jgi:hypothetical protein
LVILSYSSNSIILSFADVGNNRVQNDKDD